MPTFGGSFKRVMFYDVIQKLVYRAFKLNHNYPLLREGLLQLEVFSTLAGRKEFTTEILALKVNNMKVDFEINFEDARLVKLE